MSYTVQNRWCLTEDESRLVPENDPDARWLYAVLGQEIPLGDAVKYGLADADGASLEEAYEPPSGAAGEDETSNAQAVVLPEKAKRIRRPRKRS